MVFNKSRYVTMLTYNIPSICKEFIEIVVHVLDILEKKCISLYNEDSYFICIDVNDDVIFGANRSRDFNARVNYSLNPNFIYQIDVNERYVHITYRINSQIRRSIKLCYDNDIFLCQENMKLVAG